MTQPILVGKTEVHTLEAVNIITKTFTADDIQFKVASIENQSVQGINVSGGMTANSMFVRQNLDVNNNSVLGLPNTASTTIFNSDVLFNRRTIVDSQNITSPNTNISSWTKTNIILDQPLEYVLTLPIGTENVTYNIFKINANAKVSVTSNSAINLNMVSGVYTPVTINQLYQVVPSGYLSSFRLSQTPSQYIIDNLSIWNENGQYIHSLSSTKNLNVGSSAGVGLNDGNVMDVLGTLRLNGRMIQDTLQINGEVNVKNINRSSVSCDTQTTDCTILLSGSDADFSTLNADGFTIKVFKSVLNGQIILKASNSLTLYSSIRTSSLNANEQVVIVKEGQYGSFQLTRIGTSWVVSELQIFDENGNLYYGNGISIDGLIRNTPLIFNTFENIHISDLSSSNIIIKTSNYNRVSLNFLTTVYPNKTGIKYSIKKPELVGNLSINVTNSTGNRNRFVNMNTGITDVIPNGYVGSFCIEQIQVENDGQNNVGIWMITDLNVYNENGVNYFPNGVEFDIFQITGQTELNGDVNINSILSMNGRVLESVQNVSSQVGSVVTFSVDSINKPSVHFNTNLGNIKLNLNSSTAPKDLVVHLYKSSNSNSLILSGAKIKGSELGDIDLTTSEYAIDNFASLEIQRIHKQDDTLDYYFVRYLQRFDANGDRITSKNIIANELVAGTGNTHGFNFDSNHGIRYNTSESSLNIYASGEKKMSIYSDKVTIKNELHAPQLYTDNGTHLAPSHSFINNTDSGMYLDSLGNVAFSVNGNTAMKMESDSLTVYGELKSDVSFGNTVLHFGVNNSLYSSAVNNIDFSINGSNKLNVNLGGVNVDGFSRAQSFLASSNGSASAPAYSFSNDQNTGIFKSGADELAFSCGGNTVMQISDSSSAPQPTLRLAGQTNTGFYANGNSLVLSTNGGDNMKWQDGSVIHEKGIRYQKTIQTTSFNVSSVNTPVQELQTNSGDITITLSNLVVGTNLMFIKTTLTNKIVVSVPSNMILFDDALAFYGSTTAPYLDNIRGHLELYMFDTNQWIVRSKSVSQQNQNTYVDGTIGIQKTTQSETEPALIFNKGETQTGIYSSGNNTIKMSTNGVERFSVTSSGVESKVDFIATNVQVGAGSITQPSISFVNDTDTGLFLSDSNKISFTCGGTVTMDISSDNVVANVPLSVTPPMQSASQPAISFGTTNTGIYTPSNDNVNFSINGQNILNVNESGLNVTGGITSSGVIVGNRFVATSSGSNSTPSYTFSTDSNMNSGMYYLKDLTKTGDDQDILSFASSGTEVLRLTNQFVRVPNQLQVNSSQSASFPAIAFNVTPAGTNRNTGIYRDTNNNIDISINGSDRFQVGSLGATVIGNFNVTNSIESSRFLSSQNGTHTQPAHSFLGQTSSGMYYSNGLNFSVNGSTVISASDTNGITLYGSLNLLQSSQSEIKPAIIFSSGNTNTGIYQSATNSIDFTTNGTRRMQITNESVNLWNDLNVNNFNVTTGRVLASSGSASEPSYAFSSDVSKNTGLYYTSGSVHFSASGSEVFKVSSDKTSVMNQVNASYSSQSAMSPAIIFSENDTNSGLYRDTNGDISISKSGSKKIGVSNTTVSVYGNMDVDNNLTVTGGVTANTVSVTQDGTHLLPAIQLLSSNQTPSGLFLNQSGLNVSLNGITSHSISDSGELKMYHPIRNNSGSALIPTYGFAGTSSGIYRQDSPEALSITVNGSDRLIIDGTTTTCHNDMVVNANLISTRYISTVNGTSTQPAYAFSDGNNDTGIYYSQAQSGSNLSSRDVLNFSSGGLDVLSVRGGMSTPTTNDDIGYISTKNVLRVNRNLSYSGSRTTRPDIVFGSESDTTGLYGIEPLTNGTMSGIGISVNGTQKLHIGSQGVTVTGNVNISNDAISSRVSVGSGSSASPSYTFHDSANKDTGLYFKNENGVETIRMTANGVSPVRIDSNGIAVDNGSLRLTSGSENNPALKFSENDNTGIYQSASGNIDFTSGGTRQMNVSSSSVNIYNNLNVSKKVNNIELKQIISKALNNDNGSVGAPSYNWTIVGLGNKLFVRTLTSTESDHEYSMKTTIYVKTHQTASGIGIPDISQYVAMWCQLAQFDSGSGTYSLLSSQTNESAIRVPILSKSSVNGKYIVEYEFSFPSASNNTLGLLIWAFEHKDANGSLSYVHNKWTTKQTNPQTVNFNSTFTANGTNYNDILYVPYTWNSSEYVAGNMVQSSANGTSDYNILVQDSLKTNQNEFNGEHKQVRISVAKYMGSSTTNIPNNEISDVSKWKELTYLYDTYIVADFGVITESTRIMN